MKFTFFFKYNFKFGIVFRKVYFNKFTNFKVYILEFLKTKKEALHCHDMIFLKNHMK